MQYTQYDIEMFSLFQALDQAIAGSLMPHTPAMTRFFTRITHLGGLYVLTTVACVSAALLAAVGFYEFALAICVSLGSTILTCEILKRTFKRIRPVGPLIVQSGHSLPSGHSAGSFVLYGYLSYILISLAPREPVAWLTVAALSTIVALVGFSRVYLRVHHTTDVLVGFAIGACYIAIAASFT